jgi:hypothetical protein
MRRCRNRTAPRPTPGPLVSDQIKVTGQFLEILNGRIKKLRANSMRFKPYNSDPKAPPMPDQVAEDLVRVGIDIRTQEENLREKRNEETSMTKQFESDIARFKELKGHPLTPKTRVLLGVTGGIAAYKSPDLVRR